MEVECLICGGYALATEVRCWGCDARVHSRCLFDGEWLCPPQYWYCPGCHVELENQRDITLDRAVMLKVMHGIVPEDEVDKARAEKAAKFLSWHDKQLMLELKHGFVIVPPIRDRRRIVADAAAAAGFTSADRLYALLRERYYWHGMHVACVAECTTCRAN